VRPGVHVVAAAAIGLIVGCAPTEGRHHDDQQLTEFETLVEETGELVDRTERDLESDPR
jgi:hypothetical protein